MNLARFPRRRYTRGSTPLEPLPRLSSELGGPQIFIKRDDLLGLAGGGNKTRKLEFLMADALACDATGVITCGAVQSNHCRLTAAAAAREGLDCHLMLEERVPNSYRRDASGNNFLFHLLGVTSVTVVPAGTDMNEAMESLRIEHETEGRRSYVIPGGGSSALGALGYVACANEIIDQTFEAGIALDAVLCASGSGGTHAGLLAGFTRGRGPAVEGVSVRYDARRQSERIASLVTDTLTLLDAATLAPHGEVIVHDEYVGEGYSIPTEAMVDAVRLVAQTEAILLDPVYTGKAMAGLIDLIRRGRFTARQNVLFLHTGGSAALFAYEEVLDTDRSAR